MFSPVRILVQILFLPPFNDSDFHLAFDFVVLESRAWPLRKAGEVSILLGAWEKNGTSVRRCVGGLPTLIA